MIHHGDEAEALRLGGAGELDDPVEQPLGWQIGERVVGQVIADEALEVLRQPLEDGEVTLSRASGSLTFPSQFTLVASMNPCPCGFRSDPSKECTCPPSSVERYLDGNSLSTISGAPSLRA